MGTHSVSRYGVVACAYVAAALVLGGGGSPSPKAEIIVQLCFVAAAVAWLWWAPRGNLRMQPIPKSLVWLGRGILALPLLKLVPLPPAIWHALPNRDIERQALALIGGADSWRPLAISPPDTLASFLALVPAVTVMWATASLGRRDRHAILLVIAAIMLAGAALGALQLAGGPGMFQLYEKSHRGWLTAFHANRNAAADALLIGALALAAWFAGGTTPYALRRRRRPIVALLLLLLGLAVVLTGSRTGIALLVPVGLAATWLLRDRTAFAVKPFGIAIAGLACLFAVAAPLFVSLNPRLSGVFSRFDAAGDARTALWADTLTALTAWFPAGAGLGSYVYAFLPFERAAALDPFFPNRAHNDYLEFMIEAGALAPVYLAAGAAILGRLAWRGFRAPSDDRPILIFACATLLVITLHSAIDYPLRNMAVACLAGIAAGMLAGSGSGRTGHATDGRA